MKYLQISTLSLIILYIIHLFVVSFYFLLDIESVQKDMVFLISLLILLLNTRSLKSYIKKEDKYIYLFAIYGIVSTCFMAYANYGQPVIYSLLASRILLIFATLYVALNLLIQNISLVALYRLAFFISLFIILFNFYLYFTGNLSILYIDTTYAYRMGAIRLTIASETLIILLLFFYFHSKEKILSYIPFIGLLLTLIVVNKTRAVLIAIFIILLLSLINLKKTKNILIVVVLLFVTMLSFVFTNFESSIFQPLIDMYEQTQNNISNGVGNVNVRALELTYFWNKLDFPSIIFGYGMDNHTFKILYYKDFYLSDLGIFKVFYLYGIIGLSLYIGIYYQMYKQASKANTVLHNTGKALILFQVFAPTINVAYSMEGIFMFFIIYILIKNYNLRNDING